eukprot:7223049-Lingulodinium_polyedra.AAC.1
MRPPGGPVTGYMALWLLPGVAAIPLVVVAPYFRECAMSSSLELARRFLGSCNAVRWPWCHRGQVAGASASRSSS